MYRKLQEGVKVPSNLPNRRVDLREHKYATKPNLSDGTDKVPLVYPEYINLYIHQN